MLEGPFKTEVIRDLNIMFGDDIFCIYNDARARQGIPDLTLLFRYGFWAMLEGKKSINARQQPNQAYYIDKFADMCFAAFISPETKEAVLHELQQEYETYRSACIP